ncbi:8-oxoguanine glycosylase ogg1 [Coemansia sp. RSA 922]|nr:8-oxoguanine glycosylase ogg1 [Coemansia sp. S3946]KAJ2050489.1 8-oxoguanine glycosylase ogg1 [Coemansia sp. S16]KAJ2109328.1 8-oxoguanine glycosylase ogg1 [Coemansia sp. RSA 922]
MTIATETDNSISVVWQDLEVAPAELRLDPTLICGQAFRWKCTGPNEWTCAIFGHVVDLKQTSTSVLFRSLGRLPTASESDDELKLLLCDYFQLHISLQALCERWTKVDPEFKKLAQTQIGVRILRQPIVENLFTFIASSNNNIKRITMLVDKLCGKYGQKIETEKGAFFTFPSVQTIAQDSAVEQTMKELGFGYRARYYAKTVERLVQLDDTYLENLRHASVELARAELMKLSGVGPKVADCVLLMSLDKADAVPVDTHIWQVAQKRYVGRLTGSESVFASMLLPSDKQEQIRELAQKLSAFKSPSTKAYELAQALIVTLFSPYAGWAQGLLFSDDLVDSVDPAAAKPTTKSKPISKPKPAPAKRKAERPQTITKQEHETAAEPTAKRTGLRPRPASSVFTKSGL